MIAQAERNQIIDLINREVVPAIGCTEPIAVALCTARAAETLDGEPEKITVRLSANILKNAMGVGIPGTGMIGLPIAVALGALVGRSEYQLEVLLDRRTPAADGGEDDDVSLTLARVWDFAMTSPLDELRFILETSRLNKAAAERSFAGEFGHCVGRTLCCDRERKVMGDSIFTRILSYTSAACDARMAGAMIPVMSNSGSGNQGIAATLPVVVYAEETHASEEQTIRALTLSHLTVIYIKQSLGRLSALCGCVVAATGSSCGITYLMGGGYDQAAAAVKNMIANLTGMICDGAKPSCAMKLTSGVSTAVLSAMMAMDGHCVTPVEGIIEEDVDKCIRNLTAIGRDGMNETDCLVLRIMTNKC